MLHDHYKRQNYKPARRFFGGDAAPCRWSVLLVPLLFAGRRLFAARIAMSAYKH